VGKKKAGKLPAKGKARRAKERPSRRASPLLEFHATTVVVYKDDDSETIVGLSGADSQGKPRYLELHLIVRTIRGECHFGTKAEVGRPHRVGRDCIASAELKRDSLHVVFNQEGSLGKVGAVKATFMLESKAYQNLKRGVREVFCASDVLRIVPVRNR
jgi:hypothetical protein